MNKQGRQQFMTIFNNILSDTNNGSFNGVLLGNESSGDEIDQLNSHKEQALNMRLDQRNVLFLKKVAEAKQKILEGTYGDCEDCGDEIAKRRLVARPTASLCITCQEEKEKEDFSNIHKRRDLTSKRLTDEGDANHIKEIESFTSMKDIAFESVVDL